MGIDPCLISGIFKNMSHRELVEPVELSMARIVFDLDAGVYE